METPRLCTACGMRRIPEREIVKKNGKKWTLYKCRQCHMQDIEPYLPKKVWTGSKFIEENDEPCN